MTICLVLPLTVSVSTHSGNLPKKTTKESRKSQNPVELECGANQYPYAVTVFKLVQTRRSSLSIRSQKKLVYSREITIHTSGIENMIATVTPDILVISLMKKSTSYSTYYNTHK